MGGDSLDFVIDMWRESLYIVLVRLLVGKWQEVPSESGIRQEKFVTFYVEADVVDGIVLNYSFSSLVEDIRRTCGSLGHDTTSKKCLFVLFQ